MRVVSENVYARGKHGNLYVRRRIPAAIRAAYPAHQEHITRSLGTADRRAVKSSARSTRRTSRNGTSRRLPNAGPVACPSRAPRAIAVNAPARAGPILSAVRTAMVCLKTERR